MSEMLFVGIDASFSGTACVVLNEKGEVVKEELISTKHDKNDELDIEKRMIHIVQKISFFLLVAGIHYEKIKKVFIEGISFGSRGEASEQLAALNYYIRIFLFQNGIKFQSIPPTKLKKFITGKGNCKKNLMLKEVYKKWNVDYEDDNLCDAFSLAMMALNSYTLNGDN